MYRHITIYTKQQSEPIHMRSFESEQVQLHPWPVLNILGVQSCKGIDLEICRQLSLWMSHLDLLYLGRGLANALLYSPDICLYSFTWKIKWGYDLNAVSYLFSIFFKAISPPPIPLFSHWPCLVIWDQPIQLLPTWKYFQWRNIMS